MLIRKLMLGEKSLKSSLQEEDWTTNHLIDRLKQHLAIVVQQSNKDDDDYENNLQSKKVYDERKYYNRAHHFLKIGAFKTVPSFQIHVSDLSSKFVRELNELDREDLKYVLKQAVGRIFEDINFELYHNSISKVLKVGLQH
jgi:hypothetical protein